MFIGKRIKELRTIAGLTQAQLAEKIGVTPAAVGNYEQGVSFPKESVLEKLFTALCCTPNELLGGDSYSHDDYEHLRLYASLDESGKRKVNECTRLELLRTIRIAARNGGSDIALKKRSSKSIFDADDYKR